MKRGLLNFWGLSQVDRAPIEHKRQKTDGQISLASTRVTTTRAARSYKGKDEKKSDINTTNKFPTRLTPKCESKSVCLVRGGQEATAGARRQLGRDQL